jgi:hypothetical protein
MSPPHSLRCAFDRRSPQYESSAALVAVPYGFDRLQTIDACGESIEQYIGVAIRSNDYIANAAEPFEQQPILEYLLISQAQEMQLFPTETRNQ